MLLHVYMSLQLQINTHDTDFLTLERFPLPTWIHCAIFIYKVLIVDVKSYNFTVIAPY